MKRHENASRRLFSCLLAGALLFAVLPGRTIVNAEESDWPGYTPVGSKEELSRIRDGLDGKYYLTEDILFTAADFAEGGDFYNGGQGWEPIGTDPEHPFSGVLDGNGFSIQGLYVHLSGSQTLYAGLFGVNYGRIENLELRGGQVTAQVSPSVQGDGRSQAYAGGVAGFSLGILKGCSNNGQVTASAQADHVPVAAFAGGIAGQAGPPDEASDQIPVEACQNTGEIQATAVVGNTVKNVYVYAGGVMGDSGPHLRMANCSNGGAVSASLSGPGCVNAGGVVGHAGDFGMIDGCSNAADVTASSSQALLFAGGITGNNNSQIRRCCNTGDIEAASSDATVYTGGIAATNVGYDGFSITECYNTGNITAHADGKAYAGGVTSLNHGACALVNCFNTGNVTATHMAGGIVAEQWDEKPVTADTAASVRTCYSIGMVTAARAGAPAGAIIGKHTGRADACYFLDHMEKGVGAGDPAETVRCTSSLLQKQETFQGFDFENVWTMAGNTAYAYPELKNLPLTAAPVLPVVPPVPGDLNNDGSVTVADVMEVCKILARQTAGQAPTKDMLNRGDLDGDGLCTINDVMELCKRLARSA